LIYEAVKNYQANQRQGTVCTKTTGEVSGSGKKLWRQKGTGRARMGSIRSSIWRKGGTTFGPRPRDFSYEIPKKARRNALKSVISEKVRSEAIYIVDELKISSNKTKEALKMFHNFTFDKMLVVDSRENVELMLATRNIPNIKAIDCSEINIYDSLHFDHIMFSKDAVQRLVEVLR
jgi:large subunit ribosomal protein L4